MKKKDLKRLEHNHLAEGEATGHYHALEGVGALYERNDGVKVFDLQEGDEVVLSHQEHHRISLLEALPPGEHCSDRVREMNHFDKQAERVAD